MTTIATITTTKRTPTLKGAFTTTATGMAAMLVAACLMASAATDAHSQAMNGSNGNSDSGIGSFWRAPSLDALLNHAVLMRNRRGGDAADPAMVADDEVALERMKAWLAKGVHAPVPDEPLAWDALEAAAHRVTATTGRRGQDDAQPAVAGLHGALGLYAGSGWLGHSGDDSDSKGERIAALVKAIELPVVGESWFGDAREVALGDMAVEQLSGQFGIVHTAQALPTPLDAPEARRFRVALTQPVVRSTLHADGHVDHTSSHAVTQRGLWSDDESPCADFVPGYRLGDADARYWSALGLDAYTRSQNVGMQPVGSLVSIVTRDGLPLERAQVTRTHHVLDPKTGFAQAIQSRFDVDGDGVTDLLVWEGRGDDAATRPDELPLRHRLFFVNVLGQWHLLGHDAPVADCHGC